MTHDFTFFYSDFKRRTYKSLKAAAFKRGNTVSDFHIYCQSKDMADFHNLQGRLSFLKIYETKGYCFETNTEDKNEFPISGILHLRRTVGAFPIFKYKETPL